LWPHVITIPRFGRDVLEPLCHPALVNQTGTLLKSRWRFSGRVFRRGEELRQVSRGENDAANFVRVCDGKFNRRLRAWLSFGDDDGLGQFLPGDEIKNVPFEPARPSHLTEA